MRKKKERLVCPKKQLLEWPTVTNIATPDTNHILFSKTGSPTSFCVCQKGHTAEAGLIRLEPGEWLKDGLRNAFEEERNA